MTERKVVKIFLPKNIFLDGSLIFGSHRKRSHFPSSLETTIHYIMSSVPAWKRAGLSVKAQQQQEDEDSLTTKRIENADLTVKEIKNQ